LAPDPRKIRSRLRSVIPPPKKITGDIPLLADKTKLSCRKIDEM